jgi:Rdx family
VAALISQQTGIDVDLVVGGRGEFTVWVGDQVVAKKAGGVFPEDDEIVAAVRQGL